MGCFHRIDWFFRPKASEDLFGADYKDRFGRPRREAISLEASGMWTTRRILILSTVLLTAAPAHAEERVSAMPPIFVSPNDPDGALPMNDALTHGPAAGLGRESSSAAVVLSGEGQDRRAPARWALESGGGLHWTQDGQRPSLTYRFSDNGVMRLRGARRGVAVSATWEF